MFFTDLKERRAIGLLSSHHKVSVPSEVILIGMETKFKVKLTNFLLDQRCGSENPCICSYFIEQRVDKYIKYIFMVVTRLLPRLQGFLYVFIR